MLDHYRLLVGIVALAVCLDQGSKALASASLSEDEEISVVGDCIGLRLRANRGIAWSFGADSPVAFQRLVFPALGVVVGVALFAYYRKLPVHDWARKTAVSLVIGGGLGNLVDRLRLGAVVDFITLHVGLSRWSMSGTFNLGDAWMVVGVAILLGLAISGGAARRRTMGEGGSP